MHSKFLKEYIDLIPRIASSVNELVWWSTLMSSKNRFYETFRKVLVGELKFKSGIYGSTRNIVSTMRHIFVLFFRIIISKIFMGRKKRRIIRDLRGKKVTLIKTFGYHFTDFSNFEDPIFKKLPDYLGEKEVVLTLFEPVNVFWKSIKDSDRSNFVISYFDFVNILDIFKCSFIILKSYFLSIPKNLEVIFQDNNVSKEFKALYQFEHFSRSTIHSMTYFYLIKNICKHVEISKFIYTYENNSWERLSILALRKFSKAKIIAYQHNVAPLASANLFLGENEEDNSPVPDKILTVGKHPADILKRYGNFKNVKIEESCAIRYEYLDKLSPFSKNLKAKKLLIALEGVWQAADIMNDIYSQAEHLEGWEIVIRTHQVLPYNLLEKKINYNINDFKNFTLSTNLSLKDDFKDCSIVLYWGSTVALEAIKLGRPVINYQARDFLNFDPLFELNHFKWSWNPNLPLINILSEIEGYDQLRYEEVFAQAQEYIKDYFFPVSKAGLAPFETA